MIDSGDTAWMLTSTALVMFMTPGLAFFYAGLVRNKNVLSTMMHSFIVIGLVSVIWVIVGYSLAFGSDWFGGLVGNPADFFGMKDVGQEPGHGRPVCGNQHAAGWLSGIRGPEPGV